MKKLKIITTPDPRLREESLPVDDIDDDIKAIIAEMRRLSFEWEKNHPHELSAAMAAPQLGINKRIIIVRDNMQEKENADFIALINPKIIFKTVDFPSPDLPIIPETLFWGIIILELSIIILFSLPSSKNFETPLNLIIFLPFNS